MREIIVHSSERLAEEELDKIASIMDESICPHDSLRLTFPDYERIEGGHIYFRGSHAVDTSVWI